MPVKLIEHIGDDTMLGLWEITESEQWLLSNIQLSAKDRQYLGHFRAEERKRQWLAYRHLLNFMMGKKNLALEYDKNGKPIIMNSDLHVSVSHSGPYAAAITRRNTPVGIDIEKVSARIQKVEDRFLSDMERLNLQPDDKLDKLCIYWCAKEALYKLHGHKGLDFKKHLLIDHFPLHLQGRLKGQIHKEELNKEYQLHFKKIDDYYLVYVMGDE
jgi:phosphopantetheinyl transferase